jgi:histidine ammonia-lyase
LQPAAGTGAALAAARAQIAGPGPDRFLAPDLNAAETLVTSGAILTAVEDAVGALA